MNTVRATRQAIFIAIAIAWPVSSNAQLWVDFNSNQASGGTPVEGDPADSTNAMHHMDGYQCYHASHESIASFTIASYDVEFSGTGLATVTLTPDWPNSTAASRRQSIGRTDGQADTWLGKDALLLRDWIGTDTRGADGNGTWDGTTGTPTYITLTLGGLPAADYALRSFHHDVEHMCAFFTTEISVDGGETYSEPVTGRMTNSLTGGTPAENEVLAGTGVNVEGGDPADLSSTQNLTFTANGTDGVVLRYAPLSPGTNTTHKEFFGLNGFQLEQTTPPAPIALSITPTGSGFDLAWESQSGKLYNVRSSPNLTGDISTWTLVQGDITADPPINTAPVAPSETILFYRIEEFPAPPVTVLSENFDTVTAPALPTGWTTGANAGDTASTLWELGAPSAVGPIEAHSLEHCVGTNISADYGVSSELWLRTPPIDLTAATSATLVFQQWVDMDDFDLGDTGTVRVLDASGLPGTVTELATVKTNIQGIAPADWVEFSAKLPAAALGHSVVLEFLFLSDSVPDGDASGWYIDDVLVSVSGL